jgi:hypothetical protein
VTAGGRELGAVERYVMGVPFIKSFDVCVGGIKMAKKAIITGRE